MDKFKNTYRIPSARAPWWDYGQAGAYFITICSAQRCHVFGQVTDGKMVLSQVGRLAQALWYEIPQHSRNVKLGAFVVMPNHVHGILILGNHEAGGPVEPGHDGNDGHDGHDGHVETRHALSLHPQTHPQRHPMAKPSPQPHYQLPNRFQNQGRNTVSSMVGGYKSAVTRQARLLGVNFAWQARFYDHIIRDDHEYQRIHDYIETNPIHWGDDKYCNHEINQPGKPKL